ncbi:DUF465 domain-containing protein [Xanthobacter autotrophicus DSM 597]|uniref:YdcH family protein n=1 Tax=Xanthobacter TaxID=279 RepID=UPI001AE5627A|nr:hypothetical protein [Xanthobacter flavus]
MDQFMKSLKTRHSLIEEEISSEQTRPNPDRNRVLALKKMKLRLRDQIEYLRREGADMARVVVVHRKRWAEVTLKPAR